MHKIISDKDNQLFHAGTFKKDKKIFSSGGRVLNITSVGKNLYAAREKTLNSLENFIKEIISETIEFCPI